MKIQIRGQNGTRKGVVEVLSSHVELSETLYSPVPGVPCLDKGSLYPLYFTALCQTDNITTIQVQKVLTFAIGLGGRDH